jgi:phosphopentomutase
MALERIAKDKPDFVFLYMVETDQKGGHDHGWMTPEYLAIIHTAIRNVQRVMEAAGDEYVVVVTADHGGHDRDHGGELKEDMTIPLFFFGDMFEAGKKMDGIGLLDLAPTIADIMSVPAVSEWEGRSIIDKAK